MVLDVVSAKASHKTDGGRGRVKLRDFVRPEIQAMHPNLSSEWTSKRYPKVRSAQKIPSCGVNDTLWFAGRFGRLTA